MNKFTLFFCFLMGIFLTAESNAQKKPIATYNFSEGELGWVVKDMSDQTASVGWQLRTTNYFAVPAGTWHSPGSGNQIRNSWIISPLIDLTNATSCEFFVNYAEVYGATTYTRFEIYFQEDANLDLSLADKDAFLTQWGEMHTLLNHDENGALGVSFSTANVKADGSQTTNPLNLAMHDGKKVRMGIRVYNEIAHANNTRNAYIHQVNIAGVVVDDTPPVNSVTAIDSIGNTFARANFTANEICKVYWAVKAQGETVADLTEIKDNLGSEAFVSSGTFDYNIPGSTVPFEIADLLINTDYTLFYGSEDFSNNMSAVAATNFSSDNDLVAPVITALDINDVSETSAMAQLTADEAGTIMLRVYEAGWEPETFEQFESGQNSLIDVDAYKVADFTAPADTLLQYFEPATSYIAYATVTDLTGNVSEIYKTTSFTTLADDKAPVITSAGITEITNHGGLLTLLCDEPSAGFGDVVAHWVATAQGTAMTSEQVLNKENGLASGTAVLDSATKVNLITLDDLEKNTAYAIHCIAVDESDNLSLVTTIDITTTDALETVPVFVQDFNVENQNYHFATVTMPEGGTGWTSDPANSKVTVANKPNARDDFYDVWCIVGPIDLTNVLDIAAEWQGLKTWGAYSDKVSLLVSDAYTGDGVMDINNWTQVSEAGDFANSAEIQQVKKTVPAGFDKAGVYFAFRYYHDVWAHNWEINFLKIYGSRLGEVEPPIIDWVEALQPSSNSVNMMFAASTYGRTYWYLSEEGGTVPTMDQVKSGAMASRYGSVDYTAGNYLDQNYTLGNLKPNTTYHLYTAFRDLEYNWADGVFYDSQVNVFTTKSLEILTVEESMVHATGAQLNVSAESQGRLYWTVKKQGETAPTTYQEIFASFDKKGAFNYTVDDQSLVSWNVNGLEPETSYTVYTIMTEDSREFYSAIQSLDFTTPALTVNSATHEQAVEGEPGVYSVTFNVSASASGWMHVVMTEKGAAQPDVADILDVSAGFGGNKVSFDDPADIVLEVDNLSQAQGDDFTAWFVVSSQEYVSPVYKLDSGTVGFDDANADEDIINVINASNGLQVIYNGSSNTNMLIYNVVGQVVKMLEINPGVNNVYGLNKGMYLLSVAADGNKVTKKIVIQ